MSDNVTERYQEQFFARLLSQQENSFCADCKQKGTSWVSLGFGVFVCITCSGIHRSFGMSVTRVRSTKLDSWTSLDCHIVESIGNKIANLFYESKLNQSKQIIDSDRMEFIKNKYIKKLYCHKGIDEPVNLLIQSNYSLTHQEILNFYLTHLNKPQIINKLKNQKKKSNPKNEEADILGLISDNKNQTKNQKNADLFTFDCTYQSPKKQQQNQMGPLNLMEENKGNQFNINIINNVYNNIGNVQFYNQLDQNQKYDCLNKMTNDQSDYLLSLTHYQNQQQMTKQITQDKYSAFDLFKYNNQD